MALSFDDKFELETRLDVAARWVIRAAFESWVEEGWETSLLDIGQDDFERIIENAKQLLPADVSLDEWRTTYDWFAGRSERPQ